MPDSLRRPVRVEYLQPESLGIELIAHFLQRAGSLHRQDGTGFLIPVYALSHKIVGGKIAYLLYDSRHMI